MKNKTAMIVLVVGLAAPLCRAERPENELPMYGGKHKPSIEQNKDFGISAAKLGWQYYFQGDLDTAIKRFNQAWLFDTNSVDALWGFGLIMGQQASQEDPQKSLKESIRFLQMAHGRDPKNGRIIGDLAFSHTILGHYYKLQQKNDKEAWEHFAEAGKLFADAFKADPKYPPTVANWSVFYFYTGDYQKAKSKADEAIKMGYKFSPDYVNDLERHIK
ncbi:MAG: hypothetical protein HYV36_02245 [Lentisphaerae bacterium]|nr:hypothetical protein [Lentisphaerota bacterium]